MSTPALTFLMPFEPFTTPAERWLLRLFEDHYDERELAAILERHALASRARLSPVDPPSSGQAVVGMPSSSADKGDTADEQLTLWDW